MKTNFSKSELVVVIGVVGAWAVAVNFLLTKLDPAVQGLLYMLMAIAMPVGFLIWSLNKKDYPFSWILGIWPAIYIITIYGNDGPIFWAATKFLPVLAVISLIIITLLRWGKNNEEKAKEKAEESVEMREAQEKLNNMPIEETINLTKHLIKYNKNLKVLTIICCGLLIILIGIIVFVFSQTPLL